MSNVKEKKTVNVKAKKDTKKPTGENEKCVAPSKTKRDKWKPTKRQKAMMQCLLDPDDMRTNTERCVALRVPRATFYRWMQNPDFLEYMNNQIEGYSNGEDPAIARALIRACKRGNIEAIKLYKQLKGQLPTGSGGQVKVKTTTSTPQAEKPGEEEVVEIEITWTGDEDD